MNLRFFKKEMSELLFFIYTYKGDTKSYYRQDDIIYDYQIEIVKSEELQTQILDDSSIQYYLFKDIVDNIESLPMVVNIIYTDDDNFQSTHAIFSITNNNKLRIITVEDLQFDIDNYVPYESFLLYPLPSPRKFPTFNVFLMDRLINAENRAEIREFNFEVEHIKIASYSKPIIDLKTGLPEYILYHGLHVKFIEFVKFQKMLEKKKIYYYFIDNDIQKWAKSPNKLFLVFGVNGITYLLNARYNNKKNIIHPPK